MEEIDETKQKNRSRKKQLYASIRSQMEFYFSPSNLSKDAMTSRLLRENGSIELTQFLMYNKIRALTNNVKDLAKALKHSTELEVSEDMKVKPIVLKTKDNIDECTIYIEQIPQDAEHDWLKEQFSVYGAVDYVSIPKFSSSKKCKGFAFVEFSSPEYAEKAVEAYKKAGCYLPTSEMDPKELLSIVHNIHNKSEQSKENLPKKDDKKNKRKIEKDAIEEPLNKKIKNGNEEDAEMTENPEPAQQSTDENNPPTKETEIAENPEPAEESKMQESNDENTEDTKKKKNRNKKKKAKKTKITPETSGFKILSKKDWKRLRNKYLNVQKEKMTLLKQHLNQVKKKQRINKNFDKFDEESNVLSELVPGTIVKISVDNPIINTKEFKGEVTKINKDVKHVDLREGCTLVHARFKTDEEAKKFCEESPWPQIEILTGEEEVEYWKQIQKDRKEKQSKPKFKQKIDKNVEKVDESKNVVSELVPGTIVKISVDNPIIHTRQFKEEVTKVNNDVKYIDLREGSTLSYARFKTDEAAKKFCEDSPWPQIEILTGDEEVEYWKRIQKDREEKRNKPKVKQRGKEKLFKKAEKALGRHIIFDDV